MNKTWTIVISVIATILVLAFVFFTFVPAGRVMWNNYTHSLNKADEVDYETRKKVEDTARAMIANYNADVATYNAFKDSEVESEREYATQAKLRAIRTATSYNDYILKNSYVWEDNIPSDIAYSLEVEIGN